MNQRRAKSILVAAAIAAGMVLGAAFPRHTAFAVSGQMRVNSGANWVT